MNLAKQIKNIFFPFITNIILVIFFFLFSNTTLAQTDTIKSASDTTKITDLSKAINDSLNKVASDTSKPLTSDTTKKVAAQRMLEAIFIKPDI